MILRDITHTERLGMFGVDSGQVIITDPCYLGNWLDNSFSGERTKDSTYSYNGACHTSLNENGGGTIGVGYDGVVSQTATGDGIYTVYKCYNGNDFVGLYINLQ